jgi:hypothetical protein
VSHASQHANWPPAVLTSVPYLGESGFRGLALGRTDLSGSGCRRTTNKVSREFSMEIIKMLESIIVSTQIPSFSSQDAPCFHGENVFMGYLKSSRTTTSKALKDMAALATRALTMLFLF